MSTQHLCAIVGWLPNIAHLIDSNGNKYCLCGYHALKTEHLIGKE